MYEDCEMYPNKTPQCASCEADLCRGVEMHIVNGITLCDDCYRHSMYTVDDIPTCSECGKKIITGDYMNFYNFGKEVFICSDCIEHEETRSDADEINEFAFRGITGCL